MIKKTITYEDYNGVERTEDFYFNLTESELLQWQYSVEGGLSDLLGKIINAKTETKLIEYFKEIVLRSYGEKSDDGKRFVKSKELATAFSQTEAYNQLYYTMFTDADSASEFVKGILPKKFSESFEEEMKALEEAVPQKEIEE